MHLSVGHFDAAKVDWCQDRVVNQAVIQVDTRGNLCHFHAISFVNVEAGPGFGLRSRGVDCLLTHLLSHRLQKLCLLREMGSAGAAMAVQTRLASP